MPRILDWHQRAGRAGLRLLCLHLLWLAWTLRGGIVAGIFPATAAVHAVLRDDERSRITDPERELPLRGLRTTFAGHWRREFGPANRLGALLTLVWAIVLLDRVLVTHLDMGTLGPVLAGAHTVAGVVLAALTALVWPLQAHFTDTARGLLRRSVVLLAGRPATGALTLAGAGLLLCAYYLLPGLAPVFGIAAPAAVTSACLWRTGVFAAPAPAPAAAPALTPTH